MEVKSPRIDREKKTVKAMIKYFCNKKHKTENALCSECSGLLNYVLFRLDNCPYQEEKPTCAKCPIHCYNPTFRTRIKSVMGYSGPRMFFKHPILALLHLKDGFKRKNQIKIE